jgi:hypothetical protein
MLLHRSLALFKLLKKYPLSDVLKILKQNEQNQSNWGSIIKGFIIYYLGVVLVSFIVKRTLVRFTIRGKKIFNSGYDSDKEDSSSEESDDISEYGAPTYDFDAISMDDDEISIPPEEFIADPATYLTGKDFDIGNFGEEFIIPSTFQYSSGNEEECLKQIYEICKNSRIPTYETDSDSDSSESYTISECDSDSDQELSVPTCASASTVDKELSDSTSDKESSSVPTYDSVPLQLFNQEYLFTYNSDKESSSVSTYDSDSMVDKELSVPTCDSDSTSDKESSSVSTYDSDSTSDKESSVLINQEYLFTYDSDSSDDVSEYSKYDDVDIADDETVKR